MITDLFNKPITPSTIAQPIALELIECVRGNLYSSQILWGTCVLDKQEGDIVPVKTSSNKTIFVELTTKIANNIFYSNLVKQPKQALNHQHLRG